MKLLLKIKFWYWWYFKATDMEKIRWRRSAFKIEIDKLTRIIDEMKFLSVNVSSANTITDITYKGETIL